MKPFMCLTAIGTMGAFFQGIKSLSFFWIIVGMIHVYFLIVVYSLYDIFSSNSEENENLQSATTCQRKSEGIDYEKGGNGYQASVR